MPDLRPFRGLRYDPAGVPDMGDVLCPPYDVISGAERETLLGRSPINAVRLELPAADVASATAADLARAAQTLREWLHDGTLRRDERPMVYVYEQRFVDAGGVQRRARGYFCELRLEPYGDAAGVRPHERTLAPAREHRFGLLAAVRTHLSPVLLVFDDAGLEQDATLDEVTTATPTAADNAGTQLLWAVDPSESPAARKLLESAAQQPLTIADGHHRYETALRYRDTPGAPSGADHVLALLYGSHAGGLGVAPWHRVISGAIDADGALAAARRLFMTELVGDRDELVRRVELSGSPGVLGMWTSSGGALLRVDRSRVEPAMPSAASEQVRWLDVSVLSGTLKAMVGVSEHELTESGRLSYTHDAREAVARVERGEATVCFLLRPTPVEQVMAVAAANDFMPPKSTYFYPKAATGLVFDALDP